MFLKTSVKLQLLKVQLLNGNRRKKLHQFLFIKNGFKSLRTSLVEALLSWSKMATNTIHLKLLNIRTTPEMAV